jgi:hypothetical protein
LRERHRGYGDDDSECGDQLGDALPPGAAACSAALGKRLALVHCSHRFPPSVVVRGSALFSWMTQERFGRAAFGAGKALPGEHG